ncbi:type 1 glutamine amidotransferase domain-containing protein [Ideonella sp. BN130291]|uniref:type 1 glutamine amidotransferase domain-containing protein n=1 Tax=Ideonella sp. BN130291 TaxID=3112940 RepID=UPI002E25828C|nr:type 1 glutamine amidotransferase domain-containing protein [Ideonella sp. BN130291]
MNHKRILMVLTSNDRMGATGKPTGLWAEELAVPYYALTGAGAQVTLASPRGGRAPIDPGSLKEKGQNDPAVERLLADAALMAQVEATRPVADVRMEDFDAVFFPGGHGTMWDLPTSDSVTRLVEAAARQHKLIAAVCHGVAGLVSAKGPDGRPLVAGKRVNSFTDAEEAQAGLADAVPFLLESRLRELGAHFEGAPNWQPFALCDGRLITGQNPQSSAAVADLLLAALG